MGSEVRRGALIGVTCAAIGSAGYYLTTPDIVGALFVGVIGLAISVVIFVIMSIVGRGRHDDEP
ncbi:hypothetical protein D4740_03085 [Actinomyces sp. 2119]|uniref:Uncharacterized protein n=1 Tax=Actinomyces lilanjuaniae TaxID=2321394 RepID=A0ABN5PQA7_9ACTO|nr:MULTISPECIES: hypothetical protein [Actinomyces]AYD90598.1 hypothetical protein D5R93_12410 [Actinomyces lilanjuaniae]RJF43945.1 hypothetical protein D4740_03085 [Actinomyces sp. 2119]